MPDDQLDLFGGEVPLRDLVASPSPAARATDPATSKAAGAAAEVRFLAHRFETLQLYTGYGATDDEATIASVKFSPDGEPWHPGTTAKRRKRLEDKGLIAPRVELTGATLHRPTRTGEPAIVWRLTPAGYQLLQRWLTEEGTVRSDPPVQT